MYDTTNSLHLFNFIVLSSSPVCGSYYYPSPFYCRSILAYNRTSISIPDRSTRTVALWRQCWAREGKK